MKKILIHILIIASAVYISFVFYRTIAIYSQIETMKKTTALVNTCYKQGVKLRAYLEKIDGVKQKYKITFLYRATGLFSIRQVPQINDEEEITYYEIEKCYFSEIEAFENTNIVGISTFFLNCFFYCYVYNSDKSIKLFCIIYTIIFLFI